MTDTHPSTGALMSAALRLGTAIPAFNIPYHDMMAPVVRALRDTRTVGLITVARLEWEKFQAGSLEAIRDTYAQVKDECFTRLHLDHCPVIDEDQLPVDYMEVIGRAIAAGYESVMVDGSRLVLAENIAVTRRVVDLAHAAGLPVEAELGAVLGHEAGPLPPYEELFASGRVFTDVAEALRFVRETGVDWLSVAIGNVHGAITAARADKKTPARLNLRHLAAIREAVGIPLVLHGGSGIRREFLQDSIRNGIAKINIGTAIRQPYEAALKVNDPKAAAEGVYHAAIEQLRDELGVAGNAAVLMAG